MWFLTNDLLPIAKDASRGRWQRVGVFTISHRSTSDHFDPDLREKLILELEGISAYCIRGAIRGKG